MPAKSALRALVLMLMAASVMTGCAALKPKGGDSQAADAANAAIRATGQPRSDAEARGAGPRELPGEAANAGEQEQGAEPEIFAGSGDFIDRGAARQSQAVRTTEGGSVMLNFQGADLREVVRYVMGELLGLNYTLGPAVKGRVTMATSQPIKRDSVLPALEEILRMNGAALVRDGDLYRISPMKNALQGAAGPSLSNTGPGLNVRIVPLEYIAASEMRKILDPFLTPGSVIRVDDKRNLLILAGTRQELATWINTVDIFDVDWLKGMSVGLFPLDNTDAEALAKELKTVFGDAAEGKLSGMFRFVPIKRLNSLLVVTPQRAYLDKARTWIDRLDRTGGAGGQELHVYRMQHGDAVDAAKVLQAMFGGKSSTTSSVGGPSLAPGGGSSGIGSTDDGSDSGDQSGEGGGGRSANVTLGGENSTSGLEDQVKVIADDTNNALLIMANTADYKRIESAIKKLDISPLQVLVDATIVEVSLDGELSYGLQWYFKNDVGRFTGQGKLSSSGNGAIGGSFPGFNYSLVDSANQVRAVLSALAKDEKVKVVSAPSVMVLDNQSATIKVGDQVPVRVSETTNVTSDQPVTTSSIQYRDTGVTLEVKPRVNAGGMVTMEIRQEVNDVSTTQSSGIDSPTIQQRALESVVAVASGETIVLGGLIRDTRSRNNSGIPGLRNLPVVGPLFGATSNSSRRTELLVLLTPRVAEDSADAQAITQEFRQRMEGLSQESGQFFRSQSHSRFAAPGKDRDSTQASKPSPERDSQ